MQAVMGYIMRADTRYLGQGAVGSVVVLEWWPATLGPCSPCSGCFSDVRAHAPCGSPPTRQCRRRRLQLAQLHGVDWV